MSLFTSCASTLALFGSITLAQAQATDLVVDTFDTDTSTAWSRWWGSATQDYAFDPSVDANANANSGSLKATIGYDIAAYGGDNQFALQRYFEAEDGSRMTVDGTTYTNFVFDVRFDASSPKRPGTSDFGVWEYGLIPADFSQIALGSITATNSDWIHVAAPLDPSTPKLNAIQGVYFKMWAGDVAPTAQNALTGTTIFWVDNVKLIANTNTAPATGPSLSIASATPGLMLVASQAGAQYQRQNIRTLNSTGYSWVGAANPVTYALTIAKYPASNYSGFQTHLFLVPGGSIAASESSPDYNEPNLVFLDIQNQASGGATATFRYKTNQPSGNSMVYNSNPTNGPVGTLAQISNPTPLGTWSLTFSQDTNITLTTPSGTSTNFAFPAESAALFADPLYVYLGDQPNQIANIGQSVVVSSFKISNGPNTNAPSILSDNFAADTGLETTNTWQLAAADSAGVLVVPEATKFFVNWSAPANGFVLQSSPNLTAGSWTNTVEAFGLNAPQQVYKQFTTLIPQSIPGTNSGFFRLSSTNATSQP